MSPVRVRRPRTLTPRRPLSARRHVTDEHTPLDVVLENPAPRGLVITGGILCVIVPLLFIAGLIVLGVDPGAVPTPTPGPAPVAPWWLS